MYVLLGKEEDRIGTATESNGKVYVKLSKTSFTHNFEETIMLQIIDMTNAVLYDQSKEQNELLSLLNATVSHEMRNPLNSIMAFNS